MKQRSTCVNSPILRNASFIVESIGWSAGSATKCAESSLTSRSNLNCSLNSCSPRARVRALAKTSPISFNRLTRCSGHATCLRNVFKTIQAASVPRTATGNHRTDSICSFIASAFSRLAASGKSSGQEIRMGSRLVSSRISHGTDLPMSKSVKSRLKLKPGRTH